MVKSNIDILFAYYNRNSEYWKDGLHEALSILSFEYPQTHINLFHDVSKPDKHYDVVIAWCALDSPADKWVRENYQDTPCILCYGGSSEMQEDYSFYDAVCYEVGSLGKQIKHQNAIHAFGVNTRIFRKMPKPTKTIDVLGVGALAYWKRWERMTGLGGAVKLVIGEYQHNNEDESMEIIHRLATDGVGYIPMMQPCNLAEWYNASKLVYMPASVEGGGGRVILEARACGIPVEIEDDNPLNRYYLNCPVFSERYYADKLREAIESVC